MSTERDKIQTQFNFFKKGESTNVKENDITLFSLIKCCLVMTFLGVICMGIGMFGGIKNEIGKIIVNEVESQPTTIMTKQIVKDDIIQLKINLRKIEPEYLDRNIKVFVDVAGKNLILSIDNKNNKKTCSAEIKGEFHSSATSNNILKSCDTVLDRLVNI